MQNTFFATVIVVYYAPILLIRIYFLALLFFTWRLDNNYFWLSFFIMIACTPFNLFSEGGGEVIYRIPVYDFYGRFGLDFKELFIILFLVKAYYKGKHNPLILKSEYNIILIWLSVLWIITFILGITFQNFINFSRQMLYLTFFYSVPRLITKDNLFKIYKILSLFTILYFIDQLLSVGVNLSLAKLIKNQEVVIRSEEYIRTSSRMFLPQFFTYVFGFFFLYVKNENYNKKYVMVAMITAYLSMFTTGTRGWILGFTVVLIFYLIYQSEKRLNNIFGILGIGVILLILISYFPPIQKVLLPEV